MPPGTVAVGAPAPPGAASSLRAVGSTSPRPGSVAGCGPRVRVRTRGALGLHTHMPARPGTRGSRPGGLTKVPAGPRSPLGWQWEFWRVSVPGTRVFLDVPTGTHMAGALDGSHCPITGDSAAWRPCGTKGYGQSLERPKHPNVPRVYGPPSFFTKKTPSSESQPQGGSSSPGSPQSSPQAWCTDADLLAAKWPCLGPALVGIQPGSGRAVPARALGGLCHQAAVSGPRPSPAGPLPLRSQASSRCP